MSAKLSFSSLMHMNTVASACMVHLWALTMVARGATAGAHSVAPSQHGCPYGRRGSSRVLCLVKRPTHHAGQTTRITQARIHTTQLPSLIWRSQSLLNGSGAGRGWGQSDPSTLLIATVRWIMRWHCRALLKKQRQQTRPSAACATCSGGAYRLLTWQQPIFPPCC